MTVGHLFPHPEAHGPKFGLQQSSGTGYGAAADVHVGG